MCRMNALTTRTTRATVSVKGLRKTYGDKVVLDGVDLDIGKGEAFALLGPNGAGKTTIMLGSRGSLPGWIRWPTVICGVLALTAPFYFSAPAIPIWGIVVGAWLLVTG
jgi:ABC-type protease/lipase transport system fused ATPase/permease subunit